MKALISSFHEVHAAGLPASTDPAFRKATANMHAAHTVCSKTFSELTLEQRASLSLIVVTRFGEVSSSLEFLTALHESNIAKPILFQNSLHNSTLGFVSIQLGIRGPALTISADQETDRAIANTVETLLLLTDNVLVCSVDIVPDYLKENYLLSFPDLKPHLGWARSMIFSKSQLQNDKHSGAQNLDDFNFTDFVQQQSQGL